MTTPYVAPGLTFITPQDVISPPPTVATPGHNRQPSVEELDEIELADYGNLAPASSKAHARVLPSGLITPADEKNFDVTAFKRVKTDDDLERSEPPTPTSDNNAAGIVPGFWYPKMNKFRVLAASLQYFGNGLNDAAPGALIPYLEEWYGIGYAIVSLIFVTNAVGFISAAFCTNILATRLGRSKTLVLSELFMIAGYTIIACTPSFALIVVAYLLLGFGNAINIALNNVFCANLTNSTSILGFAHGSYGVGGIIAPIIATAMVSAGIHWARFYILAIGVRIACLFFVAWAYWNYEKEGITAFANSLQQIASRQQADAAGSKGKMKLLAHALANRTTLLGALLIFAYQGAEVSVSGWFISYLIHYRDGDPVHVGYVTSGFWAGITLGRFILSHFGGRIGEKRFVYGLGAGAIVFQLLSWFIPNVIGDAVAVAILGFVLGPIYPCCATIFTRLLPPDIQMTAISFISSAGSSGGAVVPFLTGLIAQSAGTFVLHPICIGFYAIMLSALFFLPPIVKRSE
ncbi:MFS general substrate transporter [Polychaeton citri CBS 116435]|uniref:MFS general substrate transporter n=1 Tax=Polychaeton citri CBS 116435 TaxID=1314669 RepID=A0A9P4Q7A9_9PEZI|nr:MFS general substrate transporter [Polychaeton citri CBS 116435]